MKVSGAPPLCFPTQYFRDFPRPSNVVFPCSSTDGEREAQSMHTAFVAAGIFKQKDARKTIAIIRLMKDK